MAPKQRMRIANEIASKNITMRGNVPKTTKVCYISLASQIAEDLFALNCQFYLN